MDRTETDALLISALYGELTPADEAQLTAHLESHPADRTALADLTETRAIVRDNRLLAAQHDPPQSVSALLLQEAARRARRPAAGAGWFHRFTHAVLSHPAMAAAATLVLVVGVAGTLYLRRGDTAMYDAGMMAPAAAPDPKPAAVATRTDAYRADLQEPERQGAAEPPAPPPPPAAITSDKSSPVAGAPHADVAPPRPKMAKKSYGGIDLLQRERELEPKDLDDSPTTQGVVAMKKPMRSAAAGGAAPAAPAPVLARKEERSDEQSSATAPAKFASPPPAAAAPARAAAGPLDAWARKQHDQVIALASANSCRAAAAAAIEIYNRAPGYYIANVASDPSIKPCLPYLNSERAAADRKHATSTESPPPPVQN